MCFGFVVLAALKTTTVKKNTRRCTTSVRIVKYSPVEVDGGKDEDRTGLEVVSELYSIVFTNVLFRLRIVTHMCHVFGGNRAVYDAIRVYGEISICRRDGGKNRKQSDRKSRNLKKRVNCSSP